MDTSLRRVVLLVALLNLGYFGIEFAVALTIGSVSLFADSIDFLEDASVNLLILLALGWSLRARARVGMALAVILLVPGLATLWTACPGKCPRLASWVENPPVDTVAKLWLMASNTVMPHFQKATPQTIVSTK